ncbi:hypothetical protein [Pedobacter punctiformis]|uniref:DUF4397 domain-containing protein n=1 Tax=Pedobacter punctiformis TaxID=3004097 RepID=A0ABT4LDD3_9SPHI|nr:hypothetical protein [Pedobacter sp. HCMS5-2]MCZ4245934.1 hypothetical protein [Pedobacter sp. HCMS5-2]
MNKKMKSVYIFFLFILSNVASVFAQTGINTKTPAQQLHVAGTTSAAPIGTSGISLVKPTIRIDGLNKVNNPLVYSVAAPLTSPASLVQAVSVTQDGNMILSYDYAIPYFVTSLGSDELVPPTPLAAPFLIKTPNTPSSGNLGSNGSTEGILKTYTFTLNQASVVHFLASVSVSVYDYNNPANLSMDGLAKAYHVHFRFSSSPAGAGINNSALFGSDGNSYANATNFAPAGPMYVQPESYLMLPKGVYTVQLVARIYGNDYPFTGVFGTGSADRISIVAIPY